MAISSDLHVIEGFLTGGNRADISVADELTADVFGCFVVEDKGMIAMNTGECFS